MTPHAAHYCNNNTSSISENQRRRRQVDLAGDKGLGQNGRANGAAPVL